MSITLKDLEKKLAGARNAARHHQQQAGAAAGAKATLKELIEAVGASETKAIGKVTLKDLETRLADAEASMVQHQQQANAAAGTIHVLEDLINDVKAGEAKKGKAAASGQP